MSTLFLTEKDPDTNADIPVISTGLQPGDEIDIIGNKLHKIGAKNSRIPIVIVQEGAGSDNAVKSVNNKTPDGSGNITLSATDVGVVNPDWNAISGLSEIKNKPSTLPSPLTAVNWDTTFNRSALEAIFQQSVEGAPSTPSAMFGFTAQTANGYGMQLGVGHNNTAWFRSKAAGTIGQWLQFWNAGNLKYEEGTWTPEISGSTIAGTATYGTQQGLFTRIGNEVILHFRIDGTFTVEPSGVIQIIGLPFNPRSNSAGSCWMHFAAYPAKIYIVPNTNMIRFIGGKQALDEFMVVGQFDGIDYSKSKFTISGTVTYYTT